MFLIWHNVVNKSVHSITAGVTLGDVEVCKMESVNLASFFFLLLSTPNEAWSVS